MRRKRIFAGCAGATALLLGGAAVAATIDISAHDIGGQVIGDKGPEAGVWVIAETKDFPTKFAKVVVTDDQGRFVIPDLPDANYKVWVRGYGLQDTAQSDARPGKQIHFKAAPAPSAAARPSSIRACTGIRCSTFRPRRSFPAPATRATRCPRP